eukprot:Blabericola_migrator_1__261@NODE_1069_length_5537_cov_108_299452_g79_i1_p4_GENE_NODE_1069_length_5537_cov_108_299452_g79_i1NODE_1069_length_5537_cov_108_299452_g79_i1_p4_ORF_typecomplete_len152_score25_13dUTPase/PF00692_19/7_5e32_NODE_1069_length_5537_cov_108_299452_g79_i125853040
MHLRILCRDPEVAAMYKDHKQYHKGDAGLDLFCPDEITVQPGETAKINLGIRASAHRTVGDPNSVAWLIQPRSSISKTPLRLANSIGLIDAGYRGDLMGLFDNIKNYAFTVHKGDRLLQAVAGDLSEVTFEVVSELDDTARGAAGIGSTGA